MTREELIEAWHKQEVNIDLLDGLLRCDEATGNLYWKERPREIFKTETLWRNWNRKYAGQQTFATWNTHGYRHGKLFGIYIPTHRVVWALRMKQWPTPLLDHINGDRADNRFENLKPTTVSLNARNTGLRVTNTSGVPGVKWKKPNNRWVAVIGVDGKRIHLGSFINKEDAIACREAASKKYGFSDTHGKRPSRGLEMMLSAPQKEQTHESD